MPSETVSVQKEPRRDLPKNAENRSDWDQAVDVAEAAQRVEANDVLALLIRLHLNRPAASNLLHQTRPL